MIIRWSDSDVIWCYECHDMMIRNTIDKICVYNRSLKWSAIFMYLWFLSIRISYDVMNEFFLKGTRRIYTISTHTDLNDQD